MLLDPNSLDSPSPILYIPTEINKFCWPKLLSSGGEFWQAMAPEWEFEGNGRKYAAHYPSISYVLC
jgi:hypothetical protein